MRSPGKQIKLASAPGLFTNEEKKRKIKQQDIFLDFFISHFFTQLLEIERKKK